MPWPRSASATRGEAGETAYPRLPLAAAMVLDSSDRPSTRMCSFCTDRRATRPEYPGRQERQVIWRGPSIEGPADAPLITGEKPYVVDP